MSWRAKHRSENERLLAQGPRQAPEPQHRPPLPSDPDDERRNRRPWWRAAVGLGLLVAWHLISFLPWWAALLVVFIAAGLTISGFLRSARGKRRPSPFRGLFLLWLAVSIAATVLVGLGGFQHDDRILLLVVWAILAAVWLLDRGLSRLAQMR